MSNFFVKCRFWSVIALLSLLSLTACQSTKSQVIKPTEPQQPTIALVLGGGGARGFAHVGVIKALEQNGIRPTLIVATSSGAIVGSVYASGKSADELQSIALSLREADLIDFSPSKQGLIEGQKLANFINSQVNHKPIERLAIRFAPVATNMRTGEAVAFSTGDTGQAVRASASIPNLFIAPRIPDNGGQKYVDGGRAALVPARIARQLGADVIISVDVMASLANPTNSHPKTANLTRSDNQIDIRVGDKNIHIPFDPNKIKQQNSPIATAIGNQVLGILNELPSHLEVNLPKDFPSNADDIQQIIGQIGANARANPDDIKASDIIIRPDVGKYAVFNSSTRQAMIDEGYAATIAQLGSIKATIANKQN